MWLKKPMKPLVMVKKLVVEVLEAHCLHFIWFDGMMNLEDDDNHVEEAHLGDDDNLVEEALLYLLTNTIIDTLTYAYGGHPCLYDHPYPKIDFEVCTKTPSPLMTSGHTHMYFNDVAKKWL